MMRSKYPFRLWLTMLLIVSGLAIAGSYALATPAAQADFIPMPRDVQFSQVSAGNDHTCGLKMDGSLLCWGSNVHGQSTVLPGNYQAVDAGRFFNCAIKTDDTLSCWGQNGNGQATAPDGEFLAVSGGGFHACGLKTDQTIMCWGELNSAPEGQYLAITGGVSFACAIKTDQTLTCWGTGSDGQTTPPTGTFTAVAGGWGHACALSTDQQVVCWGSNASGQAEDQTGPFTSMGVGSFHNCAIKAGDQTVLCWGYNGNGQTTAPALSFTSIGMGGEHTCGILSDSTVTCWGRNIDGQNNIPTETATFTPTETQTETPVTTETSTPDPTIESTPTATLEVTVTVEPSAELLTNTSFESQTGEGKPDLDEWTVTNGTGDKIKCNKEGKPTVARTGDCAFRFKGSIGEASKLAQLADLSVITGPATALDVSLFIQGSNINATAKIKVKYTDAELNYKVKVSLIGGAVYVENKATYPLTDAELSSIKLDIASKTASGKFYIDDVSLKYSAAAVESLIPLP